MKFFLMLIIQEMSFLLLKSHDHKRQGLGLRTLRICKQDIKLSMIHHHSTPAQIPPTYNPPKNRYKTKKDPIIQIKEIYKYKSKKKRGRKTHCMQISFKDVSLYLFSLFYKFFYISFQMF